MQNTGGFSSSKLTYPKVMRKHLVPYVHKVDRNGTHSQVAELVDADDQIDVEFRISTHIQV